MDKQFCDFKATGKPNFKELMIQFWMKDEHLGREAVLSNYGGADFDALCDRLNGVCDFKPDIGYTDKSVDGTLCFEKIDNNFCIPVALLKEASI